MARQADRSPGPRARIASGDGKVEPGSFLERRSYRRRRKTDALRLLPVLGLWLFMVPLLWPGASARLTDLGVPMSAALIYIFVVWSVLIALCAILSTAQTHDGTHHTGETPPPDRRR